LTHAENKVWIDLPYFERMVKINEAIKFLIVNSVIQRSKSEFILLFQINLKHFRNIHQNWQMTPSYCVMCKTTFIIISKVVLAFRPFFFI
jgi:hypothetical protein